MTHGSLKVKDGNNRNLKKLWLYTTRYIKNSWFSAELKVFTIFEIQLLTESFGVLSRYFLYTQPLAASIFETKLNKNK